MMVATVRRQRSGANGSQVARPAAFTLIELLVVIAIIALLVSILVPSLKQAKALAEKVRCHAGMRTHAVALRLYLEDFRDYFPNGRARWYEPANPPAYMPSWRRGTMGEYLTEQQRYFHCKGALGNPFQTWAIGQHEPTFSRNRQLLPYQGVDNVHQPGQLAMRSMKVTRQQETWLFSDGNWRGVANGYGFTPDWGRFFWYSHFDGANVCYLDGHCGWVSSEKWTPPALDADNGWCIMRNWAWMWE